MIRKLKQFTVQMVAGANIATVILMFLVGYSDRLNPMDYPTLSNIGLSFPAFLLANLGFLVFWVIFKLRWAFIPFLGFVLCFIPVRKYSPLNVSRSVPKGSIKVLSYNVWLFAGWEDHKGQDNPILHYIASQNADIVCLQEANTNEVKKETVDSVLGKIYQYQDTMQVAPGGDCIAVYSKYPILSKERIKYESKGNLSAAYRLKIDGDTVLLVNNHLETTGLDPEDKSKFKQLVKGDLDSDTAKQASKLLINKLAEATQKRAPEANAVAKYIACHRDMPIIVCGDFNDGPISYAHRTIAQGLTDCYVASGNGQGISYHRSGFYVRIDNILCSNDFEPYQCYVDNKIADSDHYPIICWLKKRSKPYFLNN